MARPLRLEHPGAIWHVTSRGNARQNIALDDVDQLRFVEILGRVVPTVRWRLHAWVLMTNHYHLLVETPDATLARGMRQLNGIYSQALNRRHERVGHLFQGRYKGILVERESHLLELVRYVVLNPVRAGMVRTPADHRWSSYAATAGLRAAADWLEVDWTLSQFGNRREEARRRFREFVSEARSVDYRPWEELRGRVWLGGERFAEVLAERARDAALSPEVPRSQRSLGPRPDLEAVEVEVRQTFGAGEADMASRSEHPARKAFTLLARRATDALLTEIALPLDLSPRSVSSLLRAAEALEGRDPVFRRQVRDCQERLLRPDSVANHQSETYPQLRCRSSHSET
jgi:REP element-mobilizing transposase RayT